MGDWTVLEGDALTVLRTLPSSSVHCCVTSPPYWALRRYHAGPQEQGSEPTLEAYLAGMVTVFAEVRRVLRDDGTAWVNMGDTYEGGGRGAGGVSGDKQRTSPGSLLDERGPVVNGAGNLLGVPWRLALALQADGWTWRSTVVWAKRSPLPESISGTRWERHRVKVGGNRQSSQGWASETGQRNSGGGMPPSDTKWSPCPGCPTCSPSDGLVLRRGSWRATRSHEVIYMLTKGAGYFSDQLGVAEVVQHAVKSEYEAMHKMPTPATPGILLLPKEREGRQGVLLQDMFQQGDGRLAEERNRASLRSGDTPKIQPESQRQAKAGGVQPNGDSNRGAAKMARLSGWEGVSQTTEPRTEGERAEGQIRKDSTRQSADERTEQDASRTGATGKSDSQAAVSPDNLREHTNGGSVGTDQDQAQGPMRLLQEEARADNGSCDPSESGRDSCGDERDPGVPVLQFEQGEQENAPGLTRNPRDVQWFAPKPLGRIAPYSEPVDVAHYAAYPPELPDWCIRASTSERGVCATCGAPWARVVEHHGATAWQSPGYTAGSGRNDSTGAGTYLGADSRTLGWKATCAHQGEPVGAMVLDPYSGTGTTGLAALRLGRRYIGIELNPQYAALSRARITADSPMLNGA